MMPFSLDGKTAYVNNIRPATVSVIDMDARVVTNSITSVNNVFSTDMMLSTDGKSLWVAHRFAGQVSVIDVTILNILTTGSETNHPNFANINSTAYAFPTATATNETNASVQSDPTQLPTFLTSIGSSGIEAHGL